MTIGIPSFVLAMEPNENRISGKFMRNVIFRALPAALTDLVLVVGVMLFYLAFHIREEMLSTICTGIMGVVGLLMVYQTSQPFNKLRKAMMIGLTAAFALCYFFLPNLFTLSALDNPSLLILVVLGLLAFSVMFVCRKGLNAAKAQSFAGTSPAAQKKTGRRRAISMDERYVAFDVETPNAQNRRMSAIGVCVIEQGQIVQELDTLVDPETHFDPFNVALTGITPEMERGQPTFAALWQSAGADAARQHLGRAQRAVRPARAGQAACTTTISTGSRRRRICAPARWESAPTPTCLNHKLNTLCDHLQLSLDHHKAGSDSRACALLLLNYLEKGLQPEAFLRTYRFADRKTIPYCGCR